MIARQWIGETLESDADSYFKYLEATGVREIRATKGNQGVWLLRRVHDGKAEFIFISSVGFVGVYQSIRWACLPKGCLLSRR